MEALADLGQRFQLSPQFPVCMQLQSTQLTFDYLHSIGNVSQAGTLGIVGL